MHTHCFGRLLEINDVDLKRIERLIAAGYRFGNDAVSHKPYWIAPGEQPVYCDNEYMAFALAWADYCRHPERRSMLSRAVNWLKGR